MGTSKLIQFNPKIQLEHTTKKYFGEYLYKIVVYAPAGRLIDSPGDLGQALEHRRGVTKHVNQSGWWGARNYKDLDKADLLFLEKLRSFRHDKSAELKLRVEEPKVQIYAKTAGQLEDLVEQHFSETERQYIEVFSGPENKETEDLLNSGAILRKVDIGYKYKVILKDGRYSSEVKNQLLNYFLNLGPEQIKVSKSGFEMLSKSTGFIWNLYFYTNDLNINSFITLISPGIISNSHELFVMPNK
jgi:hypothetical protein